MRVITEGELRDQYKRQEFRTFRLPAGFGLTPAARQFLSERRIKLVTGDSEAENMSAAGEAQAASRENQPASGKVQAASGGETEAGYYVYATGERLAKKPEHMTHLRGTALVPKNHPRIKFRGKLDSFAALLISTIADVGSQGYGELAADLGYLLDFSRQIISAEVREQPLPPLSFYGLSPEEIREHSHYPDKYYGVQHLFPQPAQGKLMARLNYVRTQCRELELAALDAFYDEGKEDQVARPDILLALNRFSSVIYILMLRMIAGRYKVGL